MNRNLRARPKARKRRRGVVLFPIGELIRLQQEARQLRDTDDQERRLAPRT